MLYRKTEKRVRYLDWALDQLTGSLSANLILIKMARRGNASGLCWMSQQRIALETGCGLSSVQRAIRHLLENGYIKDVSRSFPARITKTYRFCIDRDAPSQNDRPDRSKSPSSAIQIDTQNLNESKYESRQGKRRPIDNLCKGKETALAKAPRRRGRATQIGKLISRFYQEGRPG